jgi:isoleucyl-tRNA synthetase
VFKEVPASVQFPALEKRIIAFWKSRNIFEKSIAKEAPGGNYTFYEGPPTANGKPGVHHVISRAYKDLFPRFKTMQGYRVGRKGGWDTHGLPVEIAIEKRLGFTNKKQIEDYGIEQFNALCREWVFENIQDWNEMTERIGFWLDLEHAYVTFENSYIESCWWVMKELWERGLLVEDYKTTWHSPSSNTTLASHEVALGYRENVEDPSVYPKFPIASDGLLDRGLIDPQETRPIFLMAWTTTPWTLAANTGLAVEGEADYALVAASPHYGATGNDHLYVLAEPLLESVFGETPFERLVTFKGRALEGLRYDPILRGKVEPDENIETAWRVVVDEFVSLDDGTGIVHLAPAYGDLDLGRKHGLPTIFSVDLSGLVYPDVKPLDQTEGDGPYTGQWFKDADPSIAKDLLEHGLLFRETTILHAYPFNWRDDTPLLSYAKRSWYIRTTALKEKLLANNDRINWYPDHIRTGRFGRWLEGNVDWALSRERFWGTPLPVWVSEDGDQHCVGSVSELEDLTGRDLSDLELHRPYVDEVTFVKDGKVFKRVPYTVDVWFESGAMPYAQWHFLGDASNEDVRRAFGDNFPADYICEAIDQTRGWFYSLHALATLLTDSGDDRGERSPGPLASIAADTSAFKNVIVLGHIVDEKGEKMSKSKGNVVDPWSVLDNQGADALRWYLYSSSPPESTKRFSQSLVEETLRDFFMTLWNTYSFFVLYANLDRPDLKRSPPVQKRPDVDRWLIAKVNLLVREVTEALEGYDPTNASRAIRDFVVDELSNWYVRRNRRRFWKSANDTDKASAYASLYQALVTVCKLMAPMAPFFSEELYQNLVRSLDPEAPDSIHLTTWPQHDEALIDEDLIRDMRALVRVVELGRSARAASGIKTRQPLPEVLVRVRSEPELAGLKRLEHHLLEELNVKSAQYLDVATDFVEYDVKPNLPRIGKRLGKLVPVLRKALQEISGKEIAANVREGKETVINLEGEPQAFEPEAFLLDARSPHGYAAVEERGYLAALNTTLTPELLQEGLVRDLIRLIQNARKNAGFEVSDTILLGIDGPQEVVTAVTAHLKTVQQEVLAQDVRLSPLAEASYAEEVAIDDSHLKLFLAKLEVRAD